MREYLSSFSSSFFLDLIVVTTRPADIEGHRGKDGKFYVLDTARVFPPRPPSKGFSALLLSAAKNTMTTASLFVPTRMEDAKRLIHSKEIEQHPIPVLAGVLVVDKAAQQQQQKFNKKATMLLGSPVYGDAVVIPAG